MKDVSAVAAELEHLVKVATFESQDPQESGGLTPDHLRAVFQGEVPQLNWQSVKLVEAQVPESELIRLTTLIEAALAGYVVDGTIGNGFFNWFGGSPVFTVAKLARASVLGAAILGAERAAELLSEWSEGNSARGLDCAVGYGLSFAEPVQLDRGVRFETLATRRQAPSLLGDILQGGNWRRFIAGEVLEEKPFKVEVDFEIGPIFFKPGDMRPKAGQRWACGDWLNGYLESMFEVLTVSLDRYVSCNIVWWEFRDVVAFGLCNGVPYQVRTDNMPRYRSRPTTDDDLEQAVQLFVKRMGATDRSLAMAIGRWAKSKRPFEDLPDRLFDVRTAMESLFLDQGQGEMRFRVATHGAWYLGADAAERQAIRKTLIQAYDAASTAVHGGEVNERANKQHPLAPAQDLCRRGILKRLDEGSVQDWSKLILG